MTIYVDDVRIPATVGRYRDRRWCHLMSDQIDPAELHAFAQRIGLRRDWFQPGTRLGSRTEHDPAGDHYDVTEAMRRRAVAAGAVEIDRAGLVELLRRRRNTLAAAAAAGAIPERVR